jgi:hypothetical protein
MEAMAGENGGTGEGWRAEEASTGDDGELNGEEEQKRKNHKKLQRTLRKKKEPDTRKKY